MTATQPAGAATLKTPPPEKSSLPGFIAWAEEHYCSAPAARLANVLLANKASRWLGDVLDLISGQTHLLAQWAAEGADLLHLDQLAHELPGQERAAARGARRVKATPATTDIRNQGDSHYLQLALICRAPERASLAVTTGYNALRIWLLIEALRRAEGGNLLDEHLRTAADGLRQAGEERGQGEWLPVVERILPPTRSLNAVRLHLITTTVRLLTGKETYPPGSANERFLRAVGEIARGNSRPVPIDPRLHQGLLSAPDQPARNPPAPLSIHPGDLEDDEPASPVQPIASDLDDSDSDDQAGLQVAEVDPDRSVDELVDSARYIHLTSAAQARLPLWSWDVVNPHERAVLALRVAEAYAAPDSAFRSIAAFTELAIAAGRSLEGAVRLPLGPQADASGEWTVDLGRGCLHRTAPRRSLHKRRMSKMIGHIRQPADQLSVNLPSLCVAELSSLAARQAISTPPRRVMDLWPHRALSPTKSFLDWLRTDPVVWRLRPGMLSSVAERDIYCATADWLLARLATSQASTESNNNGLPAAASYCGYTGEQVTSALAQWWCTDPASNAAGSLIDAADVFYRSGLARMCDAVDEAGRGGDFIAHHNLVSLYWDTLLRAATGARPAEDLWHWSRFDHFDAFVFIDDKTGIDDSAARWVPVPPALLEILRRDYLQAHLPATQAMLRGQFGESAEALSSALSRSLTWIRRENGGLVAEPIGPQHRALHGAIAAEQPLVMNAFRHRARTSWRRHGCPQEIIDSLLSHSDGATRSHGDISPRIWREDAAVAMPAIKVAFEQLQARSPLPWLGSPPITELVPSADDRTSAPPYAGDRSIGRWRTLLRAARQTVAELAVHACRHDSALAVRPPEKLERPPLTSLVPALARWSEEQVAELVKDLTRTAAGTPATLGKLRLLFLGRLADHCWSRTGHKPRLRRRSFADMVRDPPRATEAAIGARQRLQCWKGLLDSIIADLPSATLRPANAAALLVVDLVITSRITDTALLADACVGKVRIVRLGAHPYIEWAPGDELPPSGHGLVRHRISCHAATFAGALQSADRTAHSIRSNAFARLKPLLSAIGLASPVALEAVCAKLCETVDALNVMDLPGNIAAARAGRLRTAARSWPDWTRANDGTYLCPPSDLAAKEEMRQSAGQESAAAPPRIGLGKAADKQARQFCSDIRSVLDTYREGGVDETPSPSQRRDLARAVGQVCLNHQGYLGPAMLDLGRWCEALFDRKVTASNLVKISSIRRYFAALSPRFERLAYAVDLRSLDDEDLTDLYLSFLEMGGIARPSYVLNRLREFHRFCASGQAMSEPDWAELSVDDIGIDVSPGFIDDSTYLRVLDRLLAGKGASSRAAAAMAIFGYRFGLRKGEAALLRVRDLVSYPGAYHVVVAKMKRRDTKSKRGRRVVPLLFELEPTESRLLEDLLLQGRERLKTDPGALLLASIGDLDAKIDADVLAREVGRAMKGAAGNRHLTEHHLRHSFACSVWTALEIPLADLPDEAARARAARVRAILLGEQSIGRRAPWALASVLGHAHPSRSYLSYVHFLCERADELVFGHGNGTTAFPAWPALVDLDQCQRLTPDDAPAGSTSTPEPPDIGTVLLCIRMLANGSEVEAIARSANVDPGWLESVVEVSRLVDHRLGFVASEETPTAATRYAKLSSTGLLAHIHRSASTRLARLMTAAQEKWLALDLSSMTLSTHELCGMVGYRRQFSLWQDSQMRFLRTLIQSLEIQPARLALLRPAALSEKVREFARQTGWIASSDAVASKSDAPTKDGALCLPEVTGRRQEPTKFNDPETIVLHRYSLTLEPDEGVGIGNRLELIFAVVCFWAWLQARSFSSDNAQSATADE